MVGPLPDDAGGCLLAGAARRGGPRGRSPSGGRGAIFRAAARIRRRRGAAAGAGKANLNVGRRSRAYEPAAPLRTERGTAAMGRPAPPAVAEEDGAVGAVLCPGRAACASGDLKQRGDVWPSSTSTPHLNPPSWTSACLYFTSFSAPSLINACCSSAPLGRSC